MAVMYAFKGIIGATQSMKTPRNVLSRLELIVFVVAAPILAVIEAQTAKVAAVSSSTTSPIPYPAAPLIPVAATANRLVPCAACWDRPRREDVIRGIMMNPPPIPAREPRIPAPVPIKKDFGTT